MKNRSKYFELVLKRNDADIEVVFVDNPNEGVIVGFSFSFIEAAKFGKFWRKSNAKWYLWTFFSQRFELVKS